MIKVEPTKLVGAKNSINKQAKIRLFLLKAKKSVFNSRGVIIAISGENAIESKREANKSIFSYERNSFNLDKILLVFCKFISIPINKETMIKYITILAKEVKYSRLTKAINKSIANKKSLNLIIEYSAFKTSNFNLKVSKLFIISLYWLITQGFFSSFKAFSFYVVFKERFYPIRITFCRPIPYTLGINIKNFSKFNNRQISFFKKTIKFFFIHFIPFRKKFNLIIPFHQMIIYIDFLIIKRL